MRPSAVIFNASKINLHVTLNDAETNDLLEMGKKNFLLLTSMDYYYVFVAVFNLGSYIIHIEII